MIKIQIDEQINNNWFYGPLPKNGWFEEFIGVSIFMVDGKEFATQTFDGQSFVIHHNGSYRMTKEGIELAARKWKLGSFE